MKAIVEANANFFKDLLGLEPAQQVLQLTDALKLVVEQDLTQVNLQAVHQASVANNPVLGQQQAAKPASKFGALVDRIMVSPEAQQVLAIIGKHEKATAVLSQMDANAVGVLMNNAKKLAVHPKFSTFSDEQHTQYLNSIIKAVVEAEAKAAPEADKKSSLKLK